MLDESASKTISLNEAVSVSLSSWVKPESPGEANDDVMDDVIADADKDLPLSNASSRGGLTFAEVLALEP